MADQATEPAPVDLPHEDGLKVFRGLLDLLTDPNMAARQKLAELTAASAECRKQLAGAQRERADVDQHKVEVLAEIEAAREAHDLRLADERAAHSAKIAAEIEDIAEKHRQADEHLKNAQQHDQRAAAVRSKSEAKLRARQDSEQISASVWKKSEMHSSEFLLAVRAMRLLDGFHQTMALHAAMHWTEQKLFEEIEQAENRDGPAVSGGTGLRH
jgi:hypothetical protein